MGLRSLYRGCRLIYSSVRQSARNCWTLQGRVDGLEKGPLLAENEAQRLRHAKIFSSFGIVLQASAIRLVGSQRRERNQTPRDIVGAFMREKIADQMTAATGNDSPPAFGILFEGGALKRVDPVANEASNGYWVPSFGQAYCRAWPPIDDSIADEL